MTKIKETPASPAEATAILAGYLRGATPPATSSTTSSSTPATSSTTSSSRPRRARRREHKRTFVASLEARGARGCRPRDFKRVTMAGVRAVFENRSGREARLALARFPRSMRAELVRIARHPGQGRELAADLHEQWSRWVVSAALLLWSERRSSRRNGFRKVMDGFTQGMICGLWRNRDGAPYSRSRVFGSSYRVGSEECSPFVALERSGFVHWAAPRTYDANPRFVGPPHGGRRFAFAVYWLRDWERTRALLARPPA